MAEKCSSVVLRSGSSSQAYVIGCWSEAVVASHVMTRPFKLLTGCILVLVIGGPALCAVAGF